jgi:hypothetical protein
VTIDRGSACVNLCSMVHTQDCFERLLVTGTEAAALERKDPLSGETPLITQVQLGEHENAKRLLQAGADANAAKARGEQALMIAAKEGREDLVQLLVDFKAEVDARDEAERTALHWASQLGHPAAVKVLLKAGANIVAKDVVSLKCETLTRPLTDLRVLGRVGCTHAFVHIFMSVCICSHLTLFMYTSPCVTRHRVFLDFFSLILFLSHFFFSLPHMCMYIFIYEYIYIYECICIHILLYILQICMNICT